MMRVTLFAILLAFVLDQGSKYIMLYMLKIGALGEVGAFPPFVTFRLGWNRGMNFGLFASHSELVRWILVALSLIISAIVWRWAGTARAPLRRIAAGLLIGGALGNALDRVLYGAVVDFLNVSCCGIVNPYVFNIADVAIFLGAIALAFLPAEQQIGRA